MPSSFNWPKIYTVGDSHALHGWIKIPGVVAQSVGPMLMYNYQHHPVLFDKIPKGSIVVFCWGEIDCRCHVHKHQPWMENIDGFVDRYIAEVKKAKQDFQVFLYNVVPPPRRADVTESESFPFLGSDEERLAYVTYLNLRLKGSGLPFIDIYDRCADESGFLNIEMSDHHVHIEDEKPIIEWLERRFHVAASPA